MVRFCAILFTLELLIYIDSTYRIYLHGNYAFSLLLFELYFRSR